MRGNVWYPLVGFALLALFVQVVAANIKIPGKSENAAKIQGWVVYGLGVFAALLMLVSGLYVTRDTWIETLFKKFVGISPWILLVVGLGMLWVFGKLLFGIIPDVVSTIALTSGLIGAAWIMPTWVKHGLPPGDIAQMAHDFIRSASDQALKTTSGWFS